MVARTVRRALRCLVMGLAAAAAGARGSGEALAAGSVVSAPVVVVFHEPGFPASDATSPSLSRLRQLLPAARVVTADRLSESLAGDACALFVLPFGSSFPEPAWEAIHSYLERGGNLLVLGGRPFTRAAFRGGSGWQLRGDSVRFIRELLIDQYQETPGSANLSFEQNGELPPSLPRFAWERAFSPILHLGGARGQGRSAEVEIDARLDALAWGRSGERRLAAPAMRIDHIRGRFAGGRWVFLSAALAPAFYETPEAQTLVRALAAVARRGSEELVVRPALPLYLPGEPIDLEIHWLGATRKGARLSVSVRRSSEEDPRDVTTSQTLFPPVTPVSLPSPATKGLHVIEARLLEDGRVHAVYRAGFWMRDAAYLRSGPRLSVNRDSFELDGRPLAVVGTTYMASDVQRAFFDQPNVAVWDRDMAAIRAAGLNMLRTGWWTGWERLCDESGRPSERTLRTAEAYLMTARRHGLPVQFNLFAFYPDVFGGANAYLDPEALARQKRLVSAMAARFHDVPFLAWDLINEPSWSRNLWTARPNGDPVEAARWNQWLDEQYPDRAALAHAWNLPASIATGPLATPSELELDEQGVYAGRPPATIYDFSLFTQQSFRTWVGSLRQAIRETGSRQLVTVGQDEGGIRDRLSPAFYAPDVDFTTSHSWWQNDSLLWESLAAKQPGLPLLVQETGIQRELAPDGIARRSPQSEAALLERKVALSFVYGSGALQWLWHTNSYMAQSDEVSIGALRADGTEKPEAGVLRGLAAFAKVLSPLLLDPEPAPVAIVTSQAAQYSPLIRYQLQAQRKAVLASCYERQIPAYLVAENQLPNLGAPRLVLLPSPQALNDETWDGLLAYVRAGGNLLGTGPRERDRHWRRARRCAALGLDASLEPVTYRSAEIRLPGRSLPLVFEQEDSRSGAQSVLEALRFADGSTLAELPHGQGRVFWCAYPVELATGLAGVAGLYQHVFGALGIAPPFASEREIPAGVLVYPIALRDAMLYVIVSDRAEDAALALRDRRTGGRVTLTLPAGHAALALLRRPDGELIGRYGF
jgi:hypothetical protein